MECGGGESYLLLRYILPGCAISVLLGNLFYAWQAHQLALRTGRQDVTALPYGINTPSLLVYIFFVMLPVYQSSGSARLAWQLGVIACLGSGVIEFLGAFIAEWIRKHTPRAALLASLAGIALGFVSMTFALQIWQKPLVAMLPLAVIMLTYFAKVRFPGGLPGGLIAVLVGTAVAWLLPSEISGVSLSVAEVGKAWSGKALVLPRWAGEEIWQVLSGQVGSYSWLAFLSVIIPMGLFNVMGS